MVRSKIKNFVKYFHLLVTRLPSRFSVQIHLFCFEGVDERK